MLQQSPTKFKIGIIASRLCDAPSMVEPLIKWNLCEHIFTNDVNAGGVVIYSLALKHHIPVTIFPVKYYPNIFVCNNAIISASDRVAIFTVSSESKSFKQAVETCKTMGKPYKVFVVTPVLTQKNE